MRIGLDNCVSKQISDIISHLEEDVLSFIHTHIGQLFNVILQLFVLYS